MRNLLYWFKINSLKTNPGKFQFMIIGKYSLKIGSITVKESDEVELLGITIDKALTFKKHIENLYCTAQCKFYALRGLRNYFELGNAFIDSQSDYAPLV